jgi:hypothetical protein
MEVDISERKGDKTKCYDDYISTSNNNFAM